MSRLLEEQTAKDPQFQYDREINGASWRSDTFDYFISRCPDAHPWLEWAERQGAVDITAGRMDAEKREGTIMTELCPYILSHHVWGFLQHCLTGSARQTCKNTNRRDGLNVWRQLVLEVNSQTHCRRHGLRDRVQMQAQVQSVGQLRIAVANWESRYNEYLEAGG